MFIKSEINLKKLKYLPYKEFLFALLIILLPSVFRFLDHNYQKYFGLNRYVNVFDFILIGIIGFCILKREKIKSYFSINVVLIVFFILFARLSILFSDGQIHHKAYYDLFKSSFVVLLFLLFLSPKFKKNNKVIVKTILVLLFTLALFEAIVGLEQFILQKRLGFNLLSEPIFGIDIRNSAKIYISQSKQFFFNNFGLSKTNHFLRAHGTFFHPNIFSGFLNISSLLTMYLIYKSQKKLLFSAFLLIQITALIFTFSRAGLASFVCSSSLFFILMLIKKYDVKKMSLIFFIILTLLGGVFSKYLLERGFGGSYFQSKSAKQMNMASSNVRNSLKNISLNMIKKHPFFGVGFRNFLIKREDYTNEKIERAYVHNIYLLIAAEMGLIAFFIFIALLFSTFYQTIKYCLNPLTITTICIIVSFLLIGFFDHYPISSHFGRIVLFVSLGFLNGAIRLNKPLSYSQRAFLYQ